MFKYCVILGPLYSIHSIYTLYRVLFLYMFSMLITKNSPQLFSECSSLSHAYFECRDMTDLTLFQALETHCAACNLVTQKYPQSGQNYQSTAWGKIPLSVMNSPNKEVSSLLSPFAQGLTVNNSFMNLKTTFQQKK